MAIVIAPEPFDSEDARAMTSRSVAEMRAVYRIEEDFTDVEPHEFEPPDGVFLVAREEASAIGCGGIRRFDQRTAEVKRMYTDPAWRGRGVARAMLEQLEASARDAGYARLVLETGTLQPHAVALYRSLGYRDMPCWGEYANDPTSICFERDLTGEV